jgi:hypothetical protein
MTCTGTAHTDCTGLRSIGGVRIIEYENLASGPGESVRESLSVYGHPTDRARVSSRKRS